MRLNYLYLAATGLLLLCAFLIIRQTGGNHPAPPPAPALPSPTTDRRLPAAVTPTAVAPAPVPPIPPTPATVTRTAPEAKPDPKTPGIRLADNVPLPAVILALNTTMKNPARKIPAPIRDAMQAIIDTFYQDLAASVRDQPPGTSATADDNTLVIEPGPAVDRARAKANETYRALFGDAAFNQMTMDALMESKLPAGTGK